MLYRVQHGYKLRRAYYNYIIQSIVGWLVGQCIHFKPTLSPYSPIIRDLLVFGNSALTSDGVVLLPESLEYEVDAYGNITPVSQLSLSGKYSLFYPEDGLKVFTFRKVGDDPTGISILNGVLSIVDELESIIKFNKNRTPSLASDIFIVKYPVGTTGGKDNSDIACDMVGSIKQGASVSIPIEYARADNAPTWDITSLKPSTESIVALANYRDYLIDQLYTAYQIPPKTFREGNSGTYSAVAQYTDNAKILIDELLYTVESTEGLIDVSYNKSSEDEKNDIV